MAKLTYIPQTVVRPRDNPGVYFACHPGDFALWFEPLSREIRETQSCVIWYDEEPEDPWEAESHLNDLEQMNLMVFPVTTRFLLEANRARDVEFPFALEHGIPVLPIVVEGSLDDLFEKHLEDARYGKIQYLGRTQTDPTAIPYEEKLKKYLNSVLIGDELAQRVRHAFEAYIFMSYRKKNRREAQDLMRRIHEHDVCRDVAIWYDEYLIPGEEFGSAIEKALQDSHVFALVVTPDLAARPNYVEQHEYPMAKDRDPAMPILPIRMEDTDWKSLVDTFGADFPEVVDGKNADALSATLRTGFQACARKLEQKKEDPEQRFLMGLAYLNGIDMEVNRARGAALITQAAEADLTEAMEKLVAMYRTGDGVERDYETAIRWQEKLTEHWKAAYEYSGEEEAAVKYLYSLWNLGDYWYEIGKLGEATEVYQSMYTASQNLAFLHNHADVWQVYHSIACSSLGKVKEADEDLPGAFSFYRQSLQAMETLTEKARTVARRRRFATTLNYLGTLSIEESNLDDARTFLQKAKDLAEALVSETASMQNREVLSLSLRNLGKLSMAKDALSDAKMLFQQALEIEEGLAEELITVENQTGLLHSLLLMSQVNEEAGDAFAASKNAELCLSIAEASAKETGTLHSRLDLAAVLVQLGDLSVAKRDISAARCFFQRAQKVLELLFEETGSGVSHRALACCMDRLGDLKKEEGDLNAAFGLYEQVMKIHMAFHRNSRSVTDCCYLSSALNNLGHVSMEGGHTDTAKAYYLWSLKICQTLDEEVDSLIIRRKLSSTLLNLGELCKRENDPVEAKSYYLQSLKIFDAIAAENPSVKSRRDLAVVLSKLGQIYNNSGDSAAAEEVFRRSLDILETLAEETDTVQSRRDLGVALEKMGNISEAKKDWSAARVFYEKALETRYALAKTIETREIRRDLAFSLINMVDLSIAEDRLPAAQVFCTWALEIRRNLAKEAATAEILRDLAVALEKAGYLEIRGNNLPEAIKRYQEVLSIFQILVEETTLVEFVQSLFATLINLKLLCQAMGDTEAALRYSEQAKKVKARLN